MIDLRVQGWHAWAPGLEDADAWRRWAHAPFVPQSEASQPRCDFLPAMQRRRLSPMARMSLHAAWPLCADDEQLPFVFASRHGETTRTYALLRDVAAAQPLSPTQFGLSVHNAIAGQWSMLRGQRGESTAIAGEADTFEHAVLEAAGMLADGAPSVLLVIAEERPPAAYDDWIADVPFSYALALRVCRPHPGEYVAGANGGDTYWRLQLTHGEGRCEVAPWPNALAFLRAMLTGAATSQHAWKERRWIWRAMP